MFDATALVLIALIAVAIGFAVGFLVARLVPGENDKKTSGRGPEPENAVEIVRIWRDKPGGGLVLGVHGRLFRSPAGMRTAERDELMAAMVDLRRWVLLPEQQVREEWVAQEMNHTGESKGVSPAGTGSLREPTEGGPMKRPSMNPVDVMSRALQSDVPKVNRPASMVAEIDEILQVNLAKRGMSKRAIRLMELPGKGMVVMIGLEQYEAVEDVPDPEVRALIRDSVSEWEQRSSAD